MSLKSLNQILHRATLNDQYKTPEWIAFSKQIREMQPHCEVCRRTTPEVKLNVHHYCYDPERKIWEYERSEVAVLCEGCHKEMHECLQQFRKFVFGYLTPASFKALNGSLAAAQEYRYDPLILTRAIAEMVSTPRSIEHFSKAWMKEPPIP